MISLNTPGQGLACLVASLALLAVTPALATPDSPMTDAQINQAVDDALAFAPSVTPHTIRTQTTEGLVTLKGSVTNLLAKDRARELAETVKGVRGVIDRLEVKARARDDAAIQDDVTKALRMDPATDTYPVSVTVAEGEATLQGRVSSWEAKHLAERLAKGVAGVRAIENDLQLDFSDPRSMEDILLDVESRLRWDAYVNHMRIAIDVDEERAVSLSGVVGTAAERSRAKALSLVRGVTAVDVSGLRVEPWAREGRFRDTEPVALEPAAIRQGIKDAFFYDPRVTAFEIEVSVNNGHATLRGTVDSLKARRSAASDARNVVGVRSISNLIVCEGERPTDDTLARRVRRALARDAYVTSYTLMVNVEDGVAELTGSVASFFEKGQADDVASRVEGVTAVENELSVDYETPLRFRPYLGYDWVPFEFEWYDFSETDTDQGA